MDALEFFMKWAVAPAIGFIFVMWQKQQSHHTEIQVLKAITQSQKEAHDREFKEMRDMFRRVFEKLDNIETVLRK